MELRHTYNRNGKIYHARCAYKTDIEDVRCDCDKVLIDLPLYRFVYVCRNYWAELMKRADFETDWDTDTVFYAKILLMRDIMPDSLFVRAGLPRFIRYSKRMRIECSKGFNGEWEINDRVEGLCPGVICDFDRRGIAYYSALDIIRALVWDYNASVGEFGHTSVNRLISGIFQVIKRKLDIYGIKHTAKSFSFPKTTKNITHTDLDERIFSVSILKAMSEWLFCMARSQNQTQLRKNVKKFNLK